MELAFLINIIEAGLRTGTPLLFATLGELITERAGVLNLGVEGMMLVGALAGFAVAYGTGNPWIGVLVAMLAGGVISLLHAFVSITLRGDQVVSGLALTFVGTGLTSVLGAPYVQVRDVPRLPVLPVPFLYDIPLIGPSILWPLFGEKQNVIFFIGLLLVPAVWFWIERTRPGLQLRAIGEKPAAADAVGVNVGALRYFYVFVGGLFAGLAGASLSLAITPLWINEMTAGQGWIAVGLVIFAGWNPWRALMGAYIFGALRRLPLDLQAIAWLPFASNPILGVWLNMIPYLFTILALVFSSREAIRKRLGAPAALGIPYVRGERGA
ncbi:MAG: ABC transporter permease [Anaerolineaceae bacterium]|nr:ABC transporter permease [Anaerolineaceae bacterium]MCB9100215.1 ABC transporter permease [Anaerolineales bacterium]